MNELKRESQIERDLIIICRSIIRRVVYRRERFKSHRVVRSTFSFFFSFGFLESTPKRERPQPRKRRAKKIVGIKIVLDIT